MEWNELVFEFAAQRGGNWSDETLKWYCRRLRVFISWAEAQGLVPEQLGPADLNRFQGYMKRLGFKWTTRRGTLTAVKALVRWLYRRKYLPANPFDDLDYRPLRRERQVRPMISLSHAQRMIRAAERDGSAAGIRDAAIMRLLLTTGIRREEVTRLVQGDIDLDTGEIVVTGKFGHQRLLKLRLTTLNAVQRWLDVRPAIPGPALFVTLNASAEPHRMGRNAVNILLNKWRDRAGLPPVSVSPHRWRRRFATELARGGNPFGLQILMGHSDISTTNDYIISEPSVLWQLMDEYAPDAPYEEDEDCSSEE